MNQNIQKYQKNLTDRESQVFAFFLNQIKKGQGKYEYTIRGLKKELRIHHQTISKIIAKFQADNILIVDNLGYRQGFCIRLKENVVLEGISASLKTAENSVVKRKYEKDSLITQVVKKEPVISEDDLKDKKEIILIGRKEEVSTILTEIKKRRDLLLYGPIGTGKTAVLLDAYRKTDKAGKIKIVYVDYSGSFKVFLIHLAYQIHEKYKGLILYEMEDQKENIADLEWKAVKKRIKRMTINDLAGVILKSIRKKDYVIICDQLEKVTPTAKAVFESLREECCLIGATWSIKQSGHLKKLWWRFKRMEIGNLKDKETKELIEYLYKEKGVHAYHPEMFRSKISKMSSGNPAAIVDMVHSGSLEKYIDKKHIREMSHDAGEQELDLTPFVLFFGVMIVAARFFALGMGNKDVYIMAGVGGAMFIFVRFFLYKTMKRGEPI